MVCKELIYRLYTYTWKYMYINVHSTLALSKQKRKKGKVTHPTIAQTNNHI